MHDLLQGLLFRQEGKDTGGARRRCMVRSRTGRRRSTRTVVAAVVGRGSSTRPQ